MSSLAVASKDALVWRAHYRVCIDGPEGPDGLPTRVPLTRPFKGRDAAESAKVAWAQRQPTCYVAAVYLAETH